MDRELLALPGAWLAGAIFALHPVCVEAVAWISEQKSTLSTLFYLAGGLTYLRFDRTRRRTHYLLALALFLMALLSKQLPHFTGKPACGFLVAARAHRMEKGCAAAYALVRYGRDRRTFHGMGRTAIYWRGGCAFRADFG